MLVCAFDELMDVIQDVKFKIRDVNIDKAMVNF